MKKTFLFFLAALFFSCDQGEEELLNDIFEVTTAGVGIDCKLILIDFKESDLERIEKITGQNGLRYHAYNLDKDSFSTGGQILIVKVRQTSNSELFPCTTLGPGYPWVTVMEVS